MVYEDELVFSCIVFGSLCFLIMQCLWLARTSIPQRAYGWHTYWYWGMKLEMFDNKLLVYTNHRMIGIKEKENYPDDNRFEMCKRTWLFTQNQDPQNSCLIKIRKRSERKIKVKGKKNNNLKLPKKPEVRMGIYVTLQIGNTYTSQAIVAE